MSRQARVGCAFQALIDEDRSYLRQLHFDGKPLNEISVKSPVLHLSVSDWNNLVTHCSRLQRKCQISGSGKTLKVRTLGCARRSLPPHSSVTHHDLKARLVEPEEQGTQEFILVRATDVV